MHAVELLEQSLHYARRAGYQIRQEWLGGGAGGVCEYGGKRWLFVDLSLDPPERLERILQALEDDSQLRQSPLPAPLQSLIQGRAA